MLSHNNPILLSHSEFESRIKLLCHVDNHSRMTEFVKNKVNAYVGYVLANFIISNIEIINELCRLIELTQDKRDKVHSMMINQLEKIHYSSAYYKEREFKRIKKNSYDLDYESFKNSMYKAIPLLEKPDEFISASLGIKEKKEHILIQVRKIKEVINEYAGKNKKGLIDEFNTNIDSLLNSLTKKNLFEVVSEAQKRISELLEDMQSNENKYYDGLYFFKSHRKQNSSLQHKINEAKTLLGNIKLTENTVALRSR